MDTRDGDDERGGLGTPPNEWTGDNNTMSDEGGWLTESDPGSSPANEFASTNDDDLSWLGGDDLAPAPDPGAATPPPQRDVQQPPSAPAEPAPARWEPDPVPPAPKAYPDNAPPQQATQTPEPAPAPPQQQNPYQEPAPAAPIPDPYGSNQPPQPAAPIPEPAPSYTSPPQQPAPASGEAAGQPPYEPPAPANPYPGATQQPATAPHPAPDPFPAQAPARDPGGYESSPAYQPNAPMPDPAPPTAPMPPRTTSEPPPPSRWGAPPPTRSNNGFGEQVPETPSFNTQPPEPKPVPTQEPVTSSGYPGFDSMISSPEVPTSAGQDDADISWLDDDASSMTGAPPAPTPEPAATSPASGTADWVEDEPNPVQMPYTAAATETPEQSGYQTQATAAGSPAGSPLPTSQPEAPQQAAPTPPLRPSSEALLTDHQVASEQPARKLPIWPMAAVGVALVLLIVGGWGSLSERSELDQRLSDLEQTLESSRQLGDLTPDEEAALRSENQALWQENTSLRDSTNDVASEDFVDEPAFDDSPSSTMDTTETGNRLAVSEPAVESPEPTETVALDSLPSETATPAPELEPAPEPEPVVAEQPKTVAPGSMPATVPSGIWFVNFASYSNEDLARDWASKLGNDSEYVMVQGITVNGKDLFRVRLTGYGSRADAQAAAAYIESKYSVGPLWVGQDKTGGQAKVTPAPAPAVDTAETNAAETQVAEVTSPTEAQVLPEPSRTPQVRVTPRLPPGQEPSLTAVETGSGKGWFIYVDTYSNGVDAESKARKIDYAGYDAKVAVEYRSGELFYRVQVVGIDDRSEGERIFQELAQLEDMPNLQLREY